MAPISFTGPLNPSTTTAAANSIPMAKKTTTKTAPPTFETALGELEELIETMESDQLPLETLVSSYEKGAELLKHCEKVLADARKRIEVVQLSGSDEKGLASGSKQDEDPSHTSDTDADDIRLF